MTKLIPSLCGILLLMTDASRAQTNGVLREVWNNLDGSTVADLTLSDNYPVAPVLRVVDASFASPVNWGERYGLRMRAWLTPETTGAYTFSVSGDDNCELWLSSSDSPTGRVRIASFSGYTNPQQWTKFASQKSAEIPLVAGQRYVI